MSKGSRKLKVGDYVIIRTGGAYARPIWAKIVDTNSILTRGRPRVRVQLPGGYISTVDYDSLELDPWGEFEFKLSEDFISGKIPGYTPYGYSKTFKSLGEEKKEGLLNNLPKGLTLNEAKMVLDLDKERKKND